MRHRLVGQLIFAVDSLATFATSGKSPMRSPAPVCTDKSALRQKSGSGGLTENMSGARLSLLDRYQFGELRRDVCHRIFCSTQAASRAEQGADFAESFVRRAMHDGDQQVTC